MRRVPWDLAPNTDTVDIRDKSLGIDSFCEDWNLSEQEAIMRDRGLHVQIRHNGDRLQLYQAIRLQKFICLAPKMLDALEDLEEFAASLTETPEWIDKAMQVLKKARSL